MLPSSRMDDRATGESVAIGNVSGHVVASDTARTVVITATEGWSGPHWDQVARVLDATDDYIANDYRVLEDGSEQWRIVYRRTDEQT